MYRSLSLPSCQVVVFRWRQGQSLILIPKMETLPKCQHIVLQREAVPCDACALSIPHVSQDAQSDQHFADFTGSGAGQLCVGIAAITSGNKSHGI